MRTIRSGRSFIQYLPINLMACELILFFLNICFLCFFNLLLSQQSKIAGIILWLFFRDFSFRLTVTTDSKSAMFRYCSNNNPKKVNSMSSVTILFYLLQKLVCKILRSIKFQAKLPCLHLHLEYNFLVYSTSEQKLVLCVALMCSLVFLQQIKG